jgi:hypothetical protein
MGMSRGAYGMGFRMTSLWQQASGSFNVEIHQPCFLRKLDEAQIAVIITKIMNAD